MESEDFYKKIYQCKDLKELAQQYGEEKQLIKYFNEGIKFAPDKARFIETKITNLEKTLTNFSCRFSSANYKEVELGEYRRIGFAWVNIGYNATGKDFEVSTYNNITINSQIPKNDRSYIYFNILKEIAIGASHAFHVAFLNNELKKLNSQLHLSNEKENYFSIL